MDLSSDLSIFCMQLYTICIPILNSMLPYFYHQTYPTTFIKETIKIIE